MDVSKKCSSECSVRFLSTPKAASRSNRIKAYTAGMDGNNVVVDCQSRANVMCRVCIVLVECIV